jgi:glucosamine-6-phosphate deaminase
VKRSPATSGKRDEIEEWLRIPAEELAASSPIPFKLLPTREALYEQFAREMFVEAREASEAGRDLAVIVPIGPKRHYPLLAELVNRANLSLRHVTYFGMDQWLDWQARPLSFDHPFNLEGYFHRNFIDLIEPDLRPLPENVIFPSVLALDNSSDEIRRREGIATTYGGFGFQGHLAFNEPPSSRWTEVTIEELRAGQTRVVHLAVDTIIAHAQRSLGGNVFGVPPMAITLGMADLLSTDRIRLYTDGGAWKQTILRILLFSAPTVDYPITLVSDHPDVCVYADAESAASPAGP